MKKTPILIAIFSLVCAVPALAANDTNGGQFHALSGLSDMHQQEITPLSDHELKAIEGQGHLLGHGTLVDVTLRNVDINIVRDVEVNDTNVNITVLSTGRIINR